MARKTVLVTGMSGLIGSAVRRQTKKPADATMAAAIAIRRIRDRVMDDEGQAA